MESEHDRLLVALEHYWHQRSRAEWLKLGDVNTKFFHLKASQKNMKNALIGLEDDQGMWCRSMDKLTGVVIVRNMPKKYLIL